MKLSARTEYACLAMLQLAQDYETGEPVQIRRIAEEHGIPARFLVQILLQLKGASLVVSTRGASGGYRLARPPREISLAEVIDVMEGTERPATNAGTREPAVYTAECPNASQSAGWCSTRSKFAVPSGRAISSEIASAFPGRTLICTMTYSGHAISSATAMSAGASSSQARRRSASCSDGRTY